MASVKIATWNINSIRARLDQVLDWVEEQKPDILCLQETKVTDQEFPEDEFGDLDYDVVYTGEPSYNGVAIASRREPRNVVKILPGDIADAQRRFISATIGDVRVVSAYVPNGKDLGRPEYQFKLEWLRRLRAHLDSAASPEQPLIVCGDFNICPSDDDAFDPSRLRGSIFLSAPEREAYRNLLDYGLSDAFRHLHPDAKQFTWWDYRGAGFARNAGLRIDHILVTKPLLPAVTDVVICTGERSKENASDHCPVVMDMDL